MSDQKSVFEVDPKKVDKWYFGQPADTSHLGPSKRRLTLYEKGSGTELAELYFYEPTAKIPTDFADPIRGGPGIVMNLPIDSFDGVLSLLQASETDGRQVVVFFLKEEQQAYLTDAPKPLGAGIRRK